jgi:hypothetical protein
MAKVEQTASGTLRRTAFEVTTSFTAQIPTTAVCEFDSATSLLPAMLTCVSFPLRAAG